MGRFFDAKGNMTDWWDEYTVKQFDQRSQCFIYQYDHFSWTDPQGKSLGLNGTLTLDENLADARGLQAAFKAWQKQEILHPDEALVGLERFSKEQIFFLSYGKFWCSKMKAEAMRNYVRSNTHSPDFARITVSISVLAGAFFLADMLRIRAPPLILKSSDQLLAVLQRRQRAKCSHPLISAAAAAAPG
jgi:predicted metalloendopeptidase